MLRSKRMVMGVFVLVAVLLAVAFPCQFLVSSAFADSDLEPGTVADSDLEPGTVADDSTPDTQEGDTISGLCGECIWTIDADGVLTIRPINGESGTLGEPLADLGLGGGATVDFGIWPWSDYTSDITGVVIEKGVIAGKSVNGMFMGLTDCEFDLSGLDTGNVEDMGWMFAYSTTKSGTVAVLDFDTSKVTSMESMFSHSKMAFSLPRIWDTSHVVNMKGMFELAGNKSLTLRFDTSSVTDMSGMFYGLGSRYEQDVYLDISAFDNSNADCTSMFEGTKRFSTLKVGIGFSFEKVDAMPGFGDDGEGGYWSTEEEQWFSPEEVKDQRSGVADTYLAVAPVSHVTRLAGANRYQTMARIVDEGFDSCDYAVVATGDNFPDALAANALAGAYECPVVLTATDSLSPSARSTLHQLGVKHVFIMGGEAAVSEAVESRIAGMGITVERVAGDDRQGTSLSALEKVKEKTGSVTTVIVATGYNFADTLSIGPWSYAYAAPIVLTGSDGKLTEDEVEAVKALGDDIEVMAVGGTAVVSGDVGIQLGLPVMRLAGANRYATSTAIAKWELSHGLTLAAPAVATGENFPDALAGAAFCGYKGSIMVLASPSNTSAVSMLTGAESAYIFGGLGAVPESVEAVVENVLG